MRARRLTTLAVASAMFVSPMLLLTSGAASARDPGSTWMGIDGQLHDDAPKIVAGKAGSGEYFLGYDFDYPCWSGAHFDKGVKRLNAMAKVIRKSGRKVLWTVLPNKATALTEQLDQDNIPHGICAIRGIADQEYVMSNYPSRDFVRMLKPLSDAKQQVYWKLDSHWTSTGASLWAKKLAQRLDPKLAKRQTYTPITATLRGELGGGTVESAPGVRPTRFVRTEELRVVQKDPTTAPSDVTWKTLPVRKTWKGNTLVLGDSFSYVALPVIEPLFNRGRFIWWSFTSTPDIVKAVQKSDTVVIQAVQRSVEFWDRLFWEDILAALKADLKPKPRR